ASSSSPGGGLQHERGGLRGGSGGVDIAKIVDFSPTWDFSPGGAKLLICLAAPL
ncbi:unnamed protein product, partial [Hapterophycus canaliculatus]